MAGRHRRDEQLPDWATERTRVLPVLATARLVRPYVAHQRRRARPAGWTVEEFGWWLATGRLPQ